MNSYRIFQYVWKLACPALLGAFVPAWAQVIPGKVPMNTSPTRVVGHPQVRLVTSAPNLVEGRELSGPSDVTVDTAGLTVAQTVARVAQALE